QGYADSRVGPIRGFETLDDWPRHTESFGPIPGFFGINHGDVIAYSCQGGGGFGDPLDREPQLVAADVGNEYVSMDDAHNLYGVVLNDGVIDDRATDALRNRLRADRVPGAEQAEDVTVPSDVQWLTPDVFQSDSGVYTRAGAYLGDPDSWVEGTIRRVVSAQEHGSFIALHENLELREYLCPLS